MLFKIMPEVIKEFPGVHIGIVAAYGINNSNHNAAIQKLLKEQQQIVASLDKDMLREHPFIKTWRHAYKKFGANPKQYSSSIERLLERMGKGEALRSINNLVDLYNTISITYFLPAGGEDLDAIVGDIRLAIAGNNEPPVQLLAEAEARSPKPGEVIYKDDKGALVRRWNWKEAERTKLTEKTKNGILFLEALPPVSPEVVEVATHQLAALVQEYCGGEVSVAFASAQYPEVVLKDKTGFVKLNEIHKKAQLGFNVYDKEMFDPAAPIHEHLSPEHEIRIEKVRKLRELGIEPWPPAKEVTATTRQILEEFETDSSTRHYALAGRLMSIRLHGKAAFAQIQDHTGQIQIYIKSDIVGKDAFNIFEHLIDIGDIIWVEGNSFRTKTGEITVQVEQYTLLSKDLHPLPEKFHGLTDIETKYRQRYLDLLVNPETRQRFTNRSKIIASLRKYLEEHAYIEVETPMLHPIAGGATARPFITHHNALNSDFYLRIAPELYLKRLTVGGIDRVYEINRNFRNEGISTKHNPEFTMLEFYTAYKDYHYGMHFVENMLREVATQICGSSQVTYNNYILDFSAIKRISLGESLISYGKLQERDLQPEHIQSTLERFDVDADPALSVGEKMLALFDKLVEPHLIQPTFITGFPIETSPLAKRDPHNPAIAARYELFIAGMEIANSYNELNDPFDQAERFHEQLRAHAAGNLEAHQFDADYVRALEYGLPPTVGVGIGIDRLVMLLTNTQSIKEVILFPTLRKKAVHE